MPIVPQGLVCAWHIVGATREQQLATLSQPPTGLCVWYSFSWCCFENQSDVFSERGNARRFPVDSMSRRLQGTILHGPDMETDVLRACFLFCKIEDIVGLIS